MKTTLTVYTYKITLRHSKLLMQLSAWHNSLFPCDICNPFQYKQQNERKKKTSWMVEQYLSKENKLNTKSIENLYFISTMIFFLIFLEENKRKCDCFCSLFFFIYSLTTIIICKGKKYHLFCKILYT